MKENQMMLVVMFQGNELPREVLLEIQKLISRHNCGEDISMYSLNETDLAKLVAKSIFNEHCKPKPVQQKLSGDDVIKEISTVFDLSNPVNLAIQFSSFITDVHLRYVMGKMTYEDCELVRKLVQLLTIGFYHEEVAKKYHYDDQSKSIISKIFFKFFDEKGNAKK